MSEQDLGIRINLEKNSLAIKPELFNEFKFKFKTSKYVWNYKLRKKMWVDSLEEIYSRDRKTGEFLIPIGLLMYFYNTVENPSEELLEWCRSMLYSDIEIKDQDCLYDEQFADMNTLVSFKRGVMQSYTGSGKTQCIGVLVKNLLNSYEGNILIAGPKNMVLDEIKVRLESFGLYTPTYFDPDQRVNCVNPNGICSSLIYKSGEMTEWLKGVRYVLCDEVDKLSDTSIALFQELERYGCEYYWGFSATAKKDDAAEIPATLQLMSVMNYNLLAVVSTFSHSVVYKIPTDFYIKLIDIQMGKPQLDYLNNDIGGDNYLHTYGHCTTDSFMRFLKMVMKKSKPLVPVYYTTIIDYWVERLPGKRLIVLRGSGYLLMQDNKVIEYLDIKGVKYLVSTGDFDAIFTTSSGFAALDCPELRDVILLSGTSAGSVIQYIGRVARKKDFRIWYASYLRKIPIITNTRETQLKLIQNYYRLCTIDKESLMYGE